MNWRIAKLLLVCGVLILGLTLGFHIGRTPEEAGFIDNASNSFSLAVPAFAQGTPSDQFPNNEAGISAYVNLEREIDFARARSVFKGIEADEDDYVIGIIELPSVAEDMWPHAYVSKSGWVMAYYPKTEPTSRIMQWAGYQRDVITTTSLKDTLVIICQKMALDPSKVDTDMHYYHFQYPNATKLLIAVDTTSGEDTFKFTIPPKLNLYEASWSHHGDVGSHYGDRWSESKVDGGRLFRGGQNSYTACGTLKPEHMGIGKPHTVWIGRNGGWTGIAIVFLYK